MAGCTGYRNPSQQEYEDTFNFLTQDQFPAILDRSIRYFSVLPQIGTYRQFRPGAKDFMDALNDVNSRELTLSGAGSFIDLDMFGHQIKRPTPYAVGGLCNSNSLCLDPVCYGFTEGMIENSNHMQSICWSLQMPCLKDMFYTDRRFEQKMKDYFQTFFSQPAVVVQAVQRTELFRDAIKVVCTSENFRYTGPVIGGSSGISLPFYIDPTDPTAFPDLDNIPCEVGGANLQAFANFVAPRLFSGHFQGGMEDVKVYGLKQDYMVAMDQTASAQDSFMDREMMFLSAMRNGGERTVANVIGDFTHDPSFPTFKANSDNVLEITTQEYLEASTLYGYVQTSNPEHGLNEYRALLLVPSNYKFTLVRPPRDDFSGLGLGAGLNFRTNSPGVFPVLSSSMFSRNTIGSRGRVIVGQGMGRNGMSTLVAQGLQPRDRSIDEAVRSEVLMTYTDASCNNAADGQIPRVGPKAVSQNRADGFMLKSTLYYGRDITGIAKPVLLIFKIDTPRAALPIKVCTVNEVEVTGEAGVSIESCCPGNQIYVILTYTGSIEDDFTVGDTAVYRTGARGESIPVEVTAVSGSVLSIQALDGETLLPCCTGVPDDYGFKAEVVNTTDATATSSEIFGVECDSETGIMTIELLEPIIDTLTGQAATITLDNGQVISVVSSGDATGVFITVEAAELEDCDLCALDCSCLFKAQFDLVIV